MNLKEKIKYSELKKALEMLKRHENQFTAASEYNSAVSFVFKGNELEKQIKIVEEGLGIIQKQQEIITELKSIIEYNDSVISDKKDEWYYKSYMSDFIKTVKKRIKEMEENY